MRITHLTHITTTTGDSRESPRSEVANSIISNLRDMIEALERDWVCNVPGQGGAFVIRRIGTGSLDSAAWTIHEPNARPMVTFVVAMTNDEGRRVWRQVVQGAELEARALGRDLPVSAAKPPQAPWLGVSLHLHALRPELLPAMQWLADFERCIAWAWIEHVWGAAQNLRAH